MDLYSLYGVRDDRWLEAARQSRTFKAAIASVDVASYQAWLNLARRRRPDLIELMREELIVNRERQGAPRCSSPGCDRPVKARGLCKGEYEAWLKVAGPDEKTRRAVYPADDQIVSWFEVDFSMAKVARRIGVARESLRDYIAHRPALEARIEPLKRLPREVVAERDRAARLRWRAENPDRVRATNRRWARKQDPAARRRWNTYNRLRRAARRSDLAPMEVVAAREYHALIKQDPCVYCGGPSGTVDHVLPINSGGLDTWDTFPPACHSCNASKNDKQLLHYLLWRARNEPTFAGGGGSNPVWSD